MDLWSSIHMQRMKGFCDIQWDTNARGEQTFRLNWASFGIGERHPDAGPEHSIFVGDLAPDVTDYLLQETFRTQYPSVRGAKVVDRPKSWALKGYGFVKFG
ncbi:Polyadenylate-binding protein RBP47B' [Camellia lanceoleosa]|uniref:Polyadenylate-binding protein RBP47B n=1 Tax=Camellia lanceoleosa TaxID=1840588 RepID=A0ACC0J1T7_9ERIC|nr:Polyadenylate-binding protein RBP47B' [Camellia lanceoleosa]